MTRLSAPIAAKFAAALLILSGNASAAGDEIGSIKKKRHLYAGNTAVGVSPSGRRFRVYFGKDGKVVYNDSKGLSQTGT